MMEHVFYVDKSCLIIREGYIPKVDYGFNHHIGIYNDNEQVIDYAHDSNIFVNYEDAKVKLKEIIRKIRKKNFELIDELKNINSLLFDKIFEK